jgi:2-dehydro-3-deoxyphosphogluconate aldolase/(4S)-4-hydroxy-2-oxoglutarate aldolase
MVDSIRAVVAEGLRQSPVIGVVRTASREEAARQARLFIEAGLQLIEITFSVPGAVELAAALLEKHSGPPWIGMGTVTTRERARQATDIHARFIVTPNTSPEVAARARGADTFLVMGGLTCTEIVSAHLLGADLVKVYPLPTVGGAAYLETVRQPLGDIPMLAAGGFGVEEIPAYRTAGAVAFGMGPTLLGASDEETGKRIERALALARGEG